MKDLMGYQRLVTKWREQVKVLHRNADNSSYEYARAIFREQAQRIEKCTDELAEVIARNVQPSLDWAQQAAKKIATLQHMGIERSLELRTHKIEEILTSCFPSQFAEARPVQQPATEPDELFAKFWALIKAIQISRNMLDDEVCRCAEEAQRALALRDVPQGPNNQEEFEKYAKQHRLDIRPSEWQQSDWTYADADVESHWQCWLAARQVPVGPEGKK